MSGFASGGTAPISSVTPAIGAISIQQSTYGAVISIVYGQTRIPGNVIWYGDFHSTAHTSQQASGGKGGGHATNTTTTYTYNAAVAMGLCEGIVTDIPTTWAGKSLTSLSDLGMSLWEGSNPQAPWDYLETAHPSQALGYQGLSYVAGAQILLDSSAVLPAFNFEVAANNQFGGGIVDANPKVIAYDFLTNSMYGAGFPISQIGDWTSYSDYCIANNIFLSPAYVSQAPAASMLTELLSITNSEVFFSEGILKIRPYGDEVATAHGVTYTPNNTICYNLNDDDFIYESGTDPVRCDRADQADVFNSISIEIKNRANQYNVEPVEAHDAGSVSDFGLRPANAITAHSICDINVARGAVQRIMQRGLYIRNKYYFTLGWRYCLLEPMDLVTITDVYLGLNSQPVRIISIDESEDGFLSIIAEEFLGQVSTNALYPNQPASGYSVNYNIAPGNANAPIAFPAPLPLSGNVSEIWLATSGSGINYGGCEIWVSDDDLNYVLKGRATGSARMGVLTTLLNQVSDPDTGSTLGVDLTQSKGTLQSGTQAQADDGTSTLCYVDGELISYRGAALTDVGKYDLTYLRRGQYGSKNNLHKIGTPFARVDGAIVRISLNYQEIGKVVYIKLRAYNQFGQGYQNLADLSPYTYVNQAPIAPEMDAVTGLELFNQGPATVFEGQDAKFSWRANSVTTSYDIGSEPYGGNSGSLGPYFRDYEVRVYSAPSIGPITLLRTEHTSDTFYTYTYEKNFEDSAGVPNRKFTIKVYQRGAQGQLSSKPASITVSNPPPVAPTGLFATAGASLVTIGATKPNLSDYLGMIVWSSTSSGFTPSDGNKVYEGPNNAFSYTGRTPNVALYFKVAFYDTFSKTVAQLNLSSEITATPFQSGIKTVTTLPVSGMVEGDVVYLTTDQQLWRYNGSAWTRSITAQQITSQLVDSQIAAMAAAKLTGQITTTQITDNSISTPKLQAASVQTANLAAGSVDTLQLNAGAVTTTKIAAGSITTALIQAGAVTATEISVSTLSAISANLGSITAGTITGALIKTASSGTRLVLNESSSNELRSYNSSGTLVMSLGGSSAGKLVISNAGAGYAPILADSQTSSSVMLATNSSTGNGISAIAVSANAIAGTATSGYGGYFVSSGANPGMYSENYATGHGARIRGGTSGSMTTSGLIGLSDGTGRCFYNETGTFGPFTGSHDAIADKSMIIEIGDIVIDRECVSRNGISDTIFKVEISSIPKQKAAIGIVNIRMALENIATPAAFIDRTAILDPESNNTNPIAKPEWEYARMHFDYVGVNAVGEGQMNVCGEGGNIEAGDFIVTSSIAGKGMRQDDDLLHNYTVAKARESVTFTSATQIKQIACIYICG